MSSMWLIDSHCHLDQPQFDADRDEVIARAQAAGVRLMVNPAVDLDSCRRVLDLADRYPAVYAAVGVHPNDSAGFDDHALAQVRELARHPKVVAIGEIGLDYYWDKVAAEQQKRALHAQLDLAAELKLPVILHSREANTDLLCVLEQWVPEIRKQRGGDVMLGVLHAFSGGLSEARRATDLGFLLGLGGPLTFTNARELRAMVPQLQLEHLVLETDAPYLAPHPRRGKRNEPAYLALVAHSLASLLGVSEAHLGAKCTETAARFFGLDSYLAPSQAGA